MSATKTVVKVRVDYEDGTYRELVGKEACEQWVAMSNAQASMAYVHGMKFETPLPWTGTTVDE